MTQGMNIFRSLFVVCLAIMVVACSQQVTSNTQERDNHWIKIDNFEPSSSLEKWTLIDTMNETEPRIENPQVTKILTTPATNNRYLLKKPAAEEIVGNRKALSFTELPVSINVGEIYTYYARINIESFPNNHVFGLSNLPPEGIIKNDYNSLEPSIRITDRFDNNENYQNDGTLLVRKGGWYDRIYNDKTQDYAKPMEVDTWYEVWSVVNNKPLSEGGQTYDVYIRGGQEFPDQQKVYTGADFRMKRELPITHFYATCNSGPIGNPFGNGGLRYDDLYMAKGAKLTSPLD